MKLRSTTAAAVTAAGVLLAACGGDSTGVGDGTLPAALVAEWFTGPSCHPQCGLTLVPVATPQDSLNLTIHSTTDLRLDRDGGFRLNISGARDTTITGTARAVGSTLILTGSAGADTIDYVVQDRYLDLSFRRTSQGDLNGDGMAETLRLKGRWQKR